MKYFTFLLIATILLGCNPKHEKYELIGTWDGLSSLDLETNEVSYPTKEDRFIVEISLDSIDAGENGTYAWEIQGDSLFLKDAGSVYLKELTSEKMVIELDFFGPLRMTFKKLK